jgi:F-type H+-transporting ATPase subunit delta
MKINFSNLSRSYSKAIFSISNKLNIQQQILMFLEFLNKATNIPAVKKIIYNNLLEEESKLDFLFKLINIEPAISKLFQKNNPQFNNKLFNAVNNFMLLLIKRKLFKLIPEIFSKYNNLYLTNNNQIQIDIISAKLLTDIEKQLILNKLIKYFNKNLVPNFLINSSIISGIIVKYNDKVMDFSLKNKLLNLKKLLKNNF